MERSKNPKIAKTNFEKVNKMGRVTLLNPQPHYQLQ